MNRITNFFIASAQNNYKPAALSYKAMIVYGILLLVLRLFLGSLKAEATAIESNALMAMINEERTNRNLNALFTNSALLKAASLKSQDMLARDFFAHVDPDGNYVWPKIIAAGYTPYKLLGENLAVDFSTAEGMIKAWLDSPTHRANLLHKEFVDQGLSAQFGDFQERYTNVTTSLFGSLTQIIKSKKIARAPVTPPPPPKQEIKGEDIPSPGELEPVVPEKVTPPPPPPFFMPAKPQKTGSNLIEAFDVSRIIFTVFGLFLLIILALDSIIIYRQQMIYARSHSSYHLSTLLLLVLISILIWWW